MITNTLSLLRSTMNISRLITRLTSAIFNYSSNGSEKNSDGSDTSHVASTAKPPSDPIIMQSFSVQHSVILYLFAKALVAIYYTSLIGSLLFGALVTFLLALLHFSPPGT